MGDRKPESVPNQRATPADETRQMRGLSQRLRQPLPQEVRTPDASKPAAPEVPVAKTHLVADPSRSAVPGVDDTRQVGAKSQPVSPEGLLPAGVQLQNRYKVLGVIGIGRMGAIYKAQDLRFPGVLRLCAMKEMINGDRPPGAPDDCAQFERG